MSTNEIRSRFEALQATDNDLNGIPDVVEDVILDQPAPFATVPFAITGTIEAEQFDKGGRYRGYYANGARPASTNLYRVSGITVNKALDKGGGYCVDWMRAGDWLKYTIDVRVTQTYAIETRVAGIGTNGAFRLEFSTDNFTNIYATTPDLVITTQGWVNVTWTMVPLAAGTQSMRLLMVSNGATAGVPGDYVGKFNYISIYPAWSENEEAIATIQVYGLISNICSMEAALQNSAMIQRALALADLQYPDDQARIEIPSGEYFVVPISPDEWKDSKYNTAAYVSRSMVEIAGAGKSEASNTTLIAFSRGTTIFYMGCDTTGTLVPVSNVTLRDIIFEGRPHIAMPTNSSGQLTNYWEKGALRRPGDTDNTGMLLVASGTDLNGFTRNLLITNCLFRNPGIDSVMIDPNVSNVLVRNCDFIFRDGPNGTFPLTNRGMSNPECPTTTNLPWTSVGMHVRNANNVVVIENTFNGSPAMTQTNVDYVADAADGIFWCQAGGNSFLARNSLTNYALEGVALESGPSAVSENDFRTYVSVFAMCALSGYHSYPGASGDAGDNCLYFVGNEVRGGRNGEKGMYQTNSPSYLPFRLNFCGNLLELYRPFDFYYDYPSSAVTVESCDYLNASGNDLLAGGQGVRFLYTPASNVVFSACSNALILANNFSNATHRAISYDSLGGVLQNATIANNVLGQGNSFHIKIVDADASKYFIISNKFTFNGSSEVAPFLDPQDAPVHFFRSN